MSAMPDRLRLVHLGSEIACTSHGLRPERADIGPAWTPVSTRSSLVLLVLLLFGVVDDVGKPA